MKKIILFLTFLFVNISQLSAQNWRTYEGSLITGNSIQQIEIKILFLDLGYIVGSYREKSNAENHKLVGKLTKDSLKLTIRTNETDEVEGHFEGFLSKKKDKLEGKIYSQTNTIFTFKTQQILWTSYTDYLKKYRALKEFKDIKSALKRPKKVLSIDIAGQNLKELPFVFNKFTNLLSINLLGNKIDTFPKAISEANSLEELSLSSNNLKILTPDIGKLNKLKILILNFNQISEIPKEIGNLVELLYLDIGDNKISNFPDEFRKLTKLQEIHIDDNLLSETEILKLKRMLPNCVIHIGSQRKK